MGWEAAFFSEIEKFPCAVLEHHYPDVPLHGDFTTIEKNEYGKIDLLVGGTPCQSFSVAGLRGGLDDDRGNLALEFCRLAQREQPRWIVWENVPGVLSSNGGRDFGSILGALEDLGYGLAYRVLDAQYFGVAQRRRRVFVVGYLGDWRPAAAVLFERHSMSGHPAPSRQARQEAARAAATSTGGSSGDGGARPDLAGPLTAGMHKGPRGTEAVESGHVVAFSSNMSVPDCQTDGTTPTLKLGGHGGGNPPAVAFSAKDYGADATEELSPTLRAGGFTNSHQNGGVMPAVSILSTVRRLTPVECERLQGFPDNFTAIPWRKKGAEDCPDGPRYKVLGNSMAVPVMRWIGERINAVDDLISLL
jgi:DNA (cytosine-5)-methyltransferase 1